MDITIRRAPHEHGSLRTLTRGGGGGHGGGGGSSDGGGGSYGGGGGYHSGTGSSGGYSGSSGGTSAATPASTAIFGAFFLCAGIAVVLIMRFKSDWVSVEKDDRASHIAGYILCAITIAVGVAALIFAVT